MFTYYLIKVAWGGGACVAINLLLLGCQILFCRVAKIWEKFFYKTIKALQKTPVLCFIVLQILIKNHITIMERKAFPTINFIASYLSFLIVGLAI